jgi:hypothetical protein
MRKIIEYNMTRKNILKNNTFDLKEKIIHL